jgi:hypothetical protein
MIRRLFLLLAASTLALLATGCTTKQPEDSSIPWSRPATWEGGIPGMGGMGGSGGGR